MKPKFSFVIPVAPARKAEVIASLKTLNYPKNKYEVIVEKGLNPSDNRNRGAKKAKGEIISFLDDDAYIDKNMLKKAEVFFLEYPEIDVMGGPQLTPLFQKGFAKISGYALSSIFGGWSLRHRYSKQPLTLEANETHLTSANLFCRRKVLDKVKFNPKLFPGEDPDFIDNAIKYRFKIAYNPEVYIYHKRREAASGLAKQIFSYGKTRTMKESFLETMKKPFFLAPSLFLLYIAFFIGLAALNFLFNIQGIFLFSIPLLLYIILNIIFSIFIAIEERDILAILYLPFTFFLIHLSYGLGLIYGLLVNKLILYKNP